MRSYNENADFWGRALAAETTQVGLGMPGLILVEFFPEEILQLIMVLFRYGFLREIPAKLHHFGELFVKPRTGFAGLQMRLQDAADRDRSIFLQQLVQVPEHLIAVSHPPAFF